MSSTRSNFFMIFGNQRLWMVYIFCLFALCSRPFSFLLLLSLNQATRLQASASKIIIKWKEMIFIRSLFHLQLTTTEQTIYKNHKHFTGKIYSKTWFAVCWWWILRKSCKFCLFYLFSFSPSSEFEGLFL